MKKKTFAAEVVISFHTWVTKDGVQLRTCKIHENSPYVLELIENGWRALNCDARGVVEFIHAGTATPMSTTVN